MTEDTEEAESHADASPTEQLRAELADCEQALDAATQESGERWDALLRVRAELDNERKRAAREIEKTHKFAIGRLIEALLPVMDSLELGLAAAHSSSDPQSLQHGMRLTLEKFGAVLADFGVETIDPQDQPFDPAYHEAMNTEPVEDLPPNSVSRVHQKGYLLNGRVVRPARVTVSTAPPDSGS